MTRKRPLMKNLCFTCLEMTLVGWFLQRELGWSAHLSHRSMSQHRQESVSLTADNGYQRHRSPIPRGLRHRGLQRPRLEVATAEGEKQSSPLIPCPQKAPVLPQAALRPAGLCLGRHCCLFLFLVLLNPRAAPCPKQMVEGILKWRKPSY